MFAIVLETGGRLDPRGIADDVAKALTITKIEARMLVRKSRGILAENVSEQSAKELQQKLTGLGLQSRLVPQAELPRLPMPSRISFIEKSEDFLLFRRGAGGTTEALAWEAIGTISAGCVVQPAFKELFENIPFSEIPGLHKLDDQDAELIRANLTLKMDNPIPDKPQDPKKKPKSIFDQIIDDHKGKLKAYVDIVTEDCSDWLRIGAEESVYVYNEVKLGGGWGFKYVMRDLQKHCPEAAFTEVSLKLLRECDIRELVFLDLEEFNRFTTWFAVRKSLCGRNVSSSPSAAPADPSTPSDSSTSSPEPDTKST